VLKIYTEKRRSLSDSASEVAIDLRPDDDVTIERGVASERELETK
jgi:hypothetical protein